MIAYWQNLNERERWMVGTALAASIIYIFYLFIYSPIMDAVQTRKEQLTEKQETLAWMQNVSQQAGSTKAKESITTSKLLSVIASELNNNALKPFPYQLQQTGTGDIQLSFDQVPYNEFLQWLWALSNKYTITTKQLTIEKTTTAGVTKLSIIISPF